MTPGEIMKAQFQKELQQQQKLIATGKALNWFNVSDEEYVRSVVRIAIRAGATSRKKVQTYIYQHNYGKFSLGKIKKAVDYLLLHKEIKGKGSKTYSWLAKVS